MADLTASVVLNLKGNLARKARRDAEALEQIGKRGGKALKAINRTGAIAARTLGKLGNRFTALIAGVSAVAAGKQIIDFDARLASIGSRAGKTGKELDKFVKDTKARFFSLAKQPDFNINPDEILDAVDEIITKTGDLDLALNSLPNIALQIRGGETPGRQAGATIADLAQKFDIKSVKEMTGALGDLTAQGDAGSFESKDFAAQSERLTSKMATLGRTGRGTVREMGALLQMFKRTTGSTEMATTSFERFIDTITSEKAEELRKAGIQLFEPEALARGENIFRSPIEILKEIILKADEIAKDRGVGIDEVLAKLFDIRAKRGVDALVAGLRKAKARGVPEAAFEDVDKFLQIEGGEALLRRRSRDLARRAKGKVERGKTGLKEAADKVIGPIIDKAVDALNIEGAPIPLEAQRPIGGTETILNRFRRRQAGLPLPPTPAEEAVGAIKEFFVNDFRRLGIDLGGGRIAGPLEESEASKTLRGLREGLEAVRRPVEEPEASKTLRGLREGLEAVRGSAEERVSGKIAVEIDISPELRARIDKLESRGIELEVDAGFMMEGG